MDYLGIKTLIENQVINYTATVKFQKNWKDEALFLVCLARGLGKRWCLVLVEKQKIHGIYPKVQGRFFSRFLARFTSCGLVAFALGTENLGSIVSVLPVRNGVWPDFALRMDRVSCATVPGVSSWWVLSGLCVIRSPINPICWRCEIVFEPEAIMQQ